jgi:hypothetical protein
MFRETNCSNGLSVGRPHDRVLLSEYSLTQAKQQIFLHGYSRAPRENLSHLLSLTRDVRSMHLVSLTE